MQRYDAIIVGAGPAGGECARNLAAAGKQVLLLEKAKDFSINNYSSGGAPLDILKTYSLPQEIVSTYWNKLSLFSSNDSHLWVSSDPMGVVLDFKKLREFLALEAQKNGAEVQMHTSFQSYEKKKDFFLVRVKNHDEKESRTLETRVLVDASGSERSVLALHQFDKAQYVEATAIEYHVEVPANLYASYANNLCFYLGHKWMPQGYGWVFPMKPNLLKIGIIRYFAHEKAVPHEDSYRFYMERMMMQCFGDKSFPIIAKHGKTLYYKCRHRERHYRQGVIGVGDAISTLNPLAAEGIRHAMASSQIAAQYILNYLDYGKVFTGYAALMRKYYGMKWNLSEMIMKKLYRETNDRKLDCVLKSFKKFNFQEILDLGFSYKFSKILKFYLEYLKSR